jgi:hypothetical protein
MPVLKNIHVALAPQDNDAIRKQADAVEAVLSGVKSMTPGQAFQGKLAGASRAAFGDHGSWHWDHNLGSDGEGK